MMVLFAALFVQMNNIQGLQAAKLDKSPSNPSNIIESTTTPRGSVQTSDGVVVAESLPSNDSLKYQRFYPQGPLYADITGFYSYRYGTDGIEASYNSYLQAHQAPVNQLRDLFRLTSPVETDDLTLTIQSKMQQTAASDIGNRIGSAVAIDPKTGAILAMYSSPTFDPNPLASHDPKAVKAAWDQRVQQFKSPNPPPMLAYRRTYAPGSTFKVVTSSAVFDHDPSLATKAYPVVSSIPLPDTNKRLQNFAGETCGGLIPVLLQVSCDTGFGQIGLDLGPQNLANEARAFGFNQVPPLDLPGVAPSFFPDAASFDRNLPFLAYSAIGQADVSTTSLQMALVTSAIADGGTIMAPHVMSEIRDPQGNLVTSYKPHAWLQATNATTAAEVNSMMVGVVQGGTATNVALSCAQVAAKTGTAQTTPGLGSNNWLVAFAPANDPKIAVAVDIPAQQGLSIDTTGSEIAGPIAKSLLGTYLGCP